MMTGDRAIFIDSALPKFDSEGRFAGYVGITFDLGRAMAGAEENGSLLSSLKSRTAELEEALSQRNQDLAASNRLLAEILEALGEGLLVTSLTDLRDPENEIQFLNPAYRKLMNLGESEAYPGMRVNDLSQFLSERGDISQDDMEERGNSMMAGDVFELNLASNGLSLEVKSIPRPDGGMVIVHTDVTKLRARTELLEKARRDAEQANKAKSDFLATMSHEIRTPMNGILGVADLLQQTPLTEEQSEYVETISRSATAMTELIGDILDFSKIEAGRLTLVDEPFDLIDLAHELQQLMQPIAKAKGIGFRMELAPELGAVVRGDKQRLRQILVNLLGNAVKFTQAGEVKFELYRSGMHEVTFVVSDTGIGIPAEKIDTVFESFEQVQTGFRREFEGTGLGLAITKSLVDGMRGGIDVVSVDGEGSRFTVAIPLPISTAVLPKSNHGHVERASTFQGLKVLLAEDNKTNQFVAKRMLESHGIAPVVVSNGKEACRRAREEAFDLVIMDLSMPEMSGLDAARAIRAAEKNQNRMPSKIVALTGNAFESDRKACLEAGMDGFLTKPVRMHELGECLARFCAENTDQTKLKSA
ncbi:MAG: ATP-binding protein [Litoreibacter sp.]|nr:ATP-binding protein [Litoreibacter sp.]